MTNGCTIQEGGGTLALGVVCRSICSRKYKYEMHQISSSIHGHRKAVVCGTWVDLAWRALGVSPQGRLSSSLESSVRPKSVESGSPGSGDGEVSGPYSLELEVVVWLSPPLPVKGSLL